MLAASRKAARSEKALWPRPPVGLRDEANSGEERVGSHAAEAAAAVAMAEGAPLRAIGACGCCCGGNSGELRRCDCEAATAAAAEADEAPLPADAAGAAEGQEPLPPPPTGQVPLPPFSMGARAQGPVTDALPPPLPGGPTATPAREDRCLFFSSRRLAKRSWRLLAGAEPVACAAAGGGATASEAMEGVETAASEVVPHAATAVVAAAAATEPEAPLGAEAAPPPCCCCSANSACRVVVEVAVVGRSGCTLACMGVPDPAGTEALPLPPQPPATAATAAVAAAA